MRFGIIANRKRPEAAKVIRRLLAWTKQNGHDYRVCEELRDFVCQLDEFELQEKMEIVTPWFTSLQPRYELIQQIVTHNAYHRGQIVTMGRNLDITNATNTDFNFYLLMAKPKSEM